MTPDEADELIANMMATWPNPTWTREQVALWHNDLAPLELEQAWAAFHDLRNTANYRPSWATFYEAYQAKIRQAHMQAAGLRGLPTGIPNPVAPLAGRLRDGWAAPTEEHDHRRGHLACPVCKLHDHDPQGRHSPTCQRCATLTTALTP